MYAISVMLSNGEIGTLSETHSETIEEAQAHFADFVKGAGDLGADWLNTDADVAIARAHVVEAAVVQLA